MARRRPAGKVVVEQARDIGALGTIIRDAGLDADRIGRTGALVLIAWLDDESVGAAELTSHVDAAMLRALWVAPHMRRRGVGAALMAAMRKAARIRGARRLYASDAEDGEWLRRFGFAPADKNIEPGDERWLRTIEPESESPALWILDISGDGIIDR
jgi:N-acetylglutamate synthase-like GNAT family acetyltransferase